MDGDDVGMDRGTGRMYVYRVLSHVRLLFGNK